MLLFIPVFHFKENIMKNLYLLILLFLASTSYAFELEHDFKTNDVKFLRVNDTSIIVYGADGSQKMFNFITKNEEIKYNNYCVNNVKEIKENTVFLGLRLDDGYGIALFSDENEKKLNPFLSDEKIIMFLDYFENDTNSIICGLNSNYKSYFYLSNDNYKTYTKKIIPEIQNIANFKINNKIFAGCLDGKIFSSNDLFCTYKLEYSQNYRIWKFVKFKNKLYALCEGGRICSKDTSENSEWSQIDVFKSTNKIVDGISLNNDKIFIINNSSSSNPSQVLMSNDGQKWENVFNYDGQLKKLNFKNNKLYVLTIDGKVFSKKIDQVSVKNKEDNSISLVYKANRLEILTCEDISEAIVEIYDVNGNLICEYRYKDNICLSLFSGSYFVKVRNNGIELNGKFIIVN